MQSLLKRFTSLVAACVFTFATYVLGFIPISTAQAAPQTRTLSTGIADASNRQGAKWRRVNFSAQRTGSATFGLSWTGSGNLRFQIHNTSGSIIGGNITSGGSPKAFSTNLVAGRAYYAAVWAYSGTGNYTFTITENFPDDTTPPSIPIGLSSPSQTTNSINLSWAASSDNVGVAGYRVYRGATQIGSPATTTFTDTGLQPSTAYTYTVRSIDGAGNTSAASDVLNVSTLSTGPADTTPPSTPQNLTSPTQTSSSIQLLWDESSDNVAVTTYTVYRDDQFAGTSQSTNFTDSGRTASTDYTYQVSASDAAGNVSELSAAITVSTTTAPAARPNVVIINLDDMRADSMADLPKVRQWMGDGGTNFPNGYVATPSCCPSRATLMSGRYVHNNGQYNQNNVGADLGLTIQRYMQDSGYFTGHSGKFLHWLNLGDRAPYWDRWTYFKGGYTNVQMNFDGQTASRQGYSTTITFDRGINYLQDFEARDDAKPFFVQLTPIAPHSPSTPEAKYANAAVPALVQRPSHTETDRKDKPPFISYTNETYAQGNSRKTAMTRALYSVDDQVDRFMKELDALGELENTMIIFTADNGYFFGEHGRGSKFLPYNEAVNVPFYIRWPGHVAAGAVDNRRVSHIDITPTILAAAGITQNHAELDGRDILSGYVRPHAVSEYYYDTANGNYITSWASIRNDQYLYVEYYNQTTTRTTPTFREYYDMVNDPYQMQNLLGDNTTANDPNVAQLSATLNTQKNCVGSACL